MVGLMLCRRHEQCGRPLLCDGEIAARMVDQLNGRASLMAPYPPRGDLYELFIA